MHVLKFMHSIGLDSQTKLAEMLGTTMPNVNKWVKGTGYPSYEMCKKLLELGMTVEDLFDIDYRSMHDHDTEKSEYEKETSSGSFQEKFDAAMAEWLKNRIDK